MAGIREFTVMHKKMKIKCLLILLTFLSSSTFLYGAEKERLKVNSTLFNKWQFLGFQKANSTEQDLLPHNIDVNIEFMPSKDMKPFPHNLKGKAPCNKYLGAFEIINENKLQFGRIIITKMACSRKEIKEDQRSMMEWERLYIDMFRKAESYEITNNELKIYFDNSTEFLIYKLADQ
jgi:heat shock protein HslJ